MKLLNVLINNSPIARWNSITFVPDTPSGDNQISVQRGFSRGKLCNIEECILRFYETEDKSKTWFFSSFGMIYHNTKIER